MKFVDLHLHSHFSDGTYKPAELAAHAQRCRLAAIALTDHDSVEGCQETARECGAVGIEFIAGIELTAEQDESELEVVRPSRVQLASTAALRPSRRRATPGGKRSKRHQFFFREHLMEAGREVKRVAAGRSPNHDYRTILIGGLA